MIVADSGHGGQTENFDGKEDDGFDEGAHAHGAPPRFADAAARQ